MSQIQLKYVEVLALGRNVDLLMGNGSARAGFEPATQGSGIRSPDQASNLFSENMGPVNAGISLEEGVERFFIP